MKIFLSNILHFIVISFTNFIIIQTLYTLNMKNFGLDIQIFRTIERYTTFLKSQNLINLQYKKTNIYIYYKDCYTENFMIMYNLNFLIMWWLCFILKPKDRYIILLWALLSVGNWCGIVIHLHKISVIYYLNCINRNIILDNFILRGIIANSWWNV